jgi:hypothetical protein
LDLFFFLVSLSLVIVGHPIFQGFGSAALPLLQLFSFIHSPATKQARSTPKKLSRPVTR